ncbi:MAG: hypothetical protein GY949_02855 [Gammaproteobacteria bacterium]|nr:hypothetical protein [Gammaproteobacteria bacterium]
MRLTHFPPAVHAVMLSACAAEPVLLNSERIEQRFGSYGIEVLASEARLRRSSLYSFSDDRPVCRTYAAVRFADQLDERYSEEHSKVLAGNSIGAIFKSHGWEVHKQTMYIGRLDLPEKQTSINQLMHTTSAQDLALHVYQLLLVKNEQVFEYAMIVETHHPDYLSEKMLRELYEYDTTTVLPPESVSQIVALVLNKEN